MPPHVHTYTVFHLVMAGLLSKQMFYPRDKHVFQQLFHLLCLESSPVVRD